MKKQDGLIEIKTYCGMCGNWCPVVANVENGVFTGVKPDDDHPLAVGFCVKGAVAPELVYNKHRLQYPMKRITPKGAPDPKWQRISWEEALDTIAEKLNEIKKKYGPEAVAFTRSGPGGSPMGEVSPWVERLAHAYGSPNNIGTTNICQWHRDNCSSYTFANPKIYRAQGRSEFERAGCILIWGTDIHASKSSFIPLVKNGIKNGAKLVVIDPRKIELANIADMWLQIKPGADCALALSLINVFIEENLFDHEFVRDWTTAPFLVRSDNGKFLKANELVSTGNPNAFVIVDAGSKDYKPCLPGEVLSFKPSIEGQFNVKIINGETITCKTVFTLLKEAVASYSPGNVEKITSIPEEKIRATARMLNRKPLSMYSFNGIEQNPNASQTNRAICILYALTGSYDMPGGNVISPRIPMNPVNGVEFLTQELEEKRLGFKERPLGASGPTARTTQAYEVYKAILTDKPYPIKGLLGFGNNLATSNMPGLGGRDALCKLDFFAQAELFMTPTAELADIVLPSASCWESWHIGTNLTPFSDKAFIRLRPAIVSPQYESWPDMKILFTLAKKLGLSDKFWNGDAEAAFEYMLAPSNITMDQLRNRPDGVILNLQMAYQKYSKKDTSGNYIGFPTPSKRVELYSSIFHDHGYSPLPFWKEPAIFKKDDNSKKYPMIMITTKVAEYCHSQHRSLPSLRKRVPEPFLEIHPKTARGKGIKEGETIILGTPHGEITLKAKVTDTILENVVANQNGWWQSCPELNLPGYDAYSEQGANDVLLHNPDPENIDSLSGGFLVKGYPCNIRKI